MSANPWRTAHTTAVRSNSSRLSGSAPAASRDRTTSVCPPQAAPHSGRSPPSGPLARFGSAPAASSSRTAPGRSLTAAR
nr:hypothetical protein [Streptomyces sp. GMY02]